ncbi:PREDICTED: cullin-2-like isoform X2 [Amphimedon queenslandica]|uniref:Cullin family profile domain-containing protein n=1 Tax=Amphimedon queenslandica TaxID=400682 RepID=A0AAN0JJ62_AMPQE|nr:PREDICTED: cullin-2-like isoform X2 [Amphimedon queenslandica]|eukprot:XP_019857070.1 PREDICTED: cullin-2-like isoform X2 [Amphimedon queenslandica]
MSLRPGVVDFDEKWKDLSATISAVVELRPVKRLTWNNNISDIYALCAALPKSFAEKLYESTRSLLEDSVTALAEEIIVLDSRSLFCRYHYSWSLYRQGAHYLDSLFSYFNRVHLNKYRPQDSLDYNVPGIILPPTSPVDPNAPVEIRNMSLKVWRTRMIDVIEEKLISAVINEVVKEGNQSDLGMAHDVLQSFIEVTEYDKERPYEYYQRVFEDVFLSEISSIYRKLASQLVTDLSYPQYIKEFVRECEMKLVTDQLQYLLSYVPQMMRSEQFENLSNLFILLSRIPKTLETLIKEFKEKVTNDGLVCIKAFMSSKQSVEALEFMTIILNVYSKYKDIVFDVFGGNKSFLNALNEGCRGFVNYSEGHQQHCQSPRLLARYTDQLLKKGTKGITDTELEEKLDDTITVFNFIEDKDTFQKFYSRMLSRRLVYGFYVSMEAEENMVQKLKHVCGYEYTARLQRMLMDITLSQNLVTEFHEKLKSDKEKETISFSTLVLQSGAWQLSQSPCPSIVLPQELLTSLIKFEGFYSSRHCGRHLSWLHHLATGELKLQYLKRSYFVTMTTYQIIILLLFETKESLDLQTMSSWTQIEEKELKPTVQSLVDAKILISTGQELLLNFNYSNKRTKFKISGQLQRETTQDIEQTHQMVLEDRKMFIQAALVRVMKHRKILKHNQLIEEVILLIKHRFYPNISLIKKCIEALIDKQYIERDAESRDTYHYIA